MKTLHKNKQVKWLYSINKTTLFLVYLFLLSVSSFSQSIAIDVTNTQQSISMMGGDMERSGSNFHNAGNKEEVINWCIKDIPFNTWRVKYDKTQEMDEGVKNFGIYDSDLEAMQMIIAANPSIKFFATMKSDYNGYNEGNRNNLPTFIYDYAYNTSNGTTSGTKSFDAVKYGIFLADYVEYMEQSGVPIAYLSTSKEWAQVMTAARANLTIATLKTELTTRGIAMPLIVDAGTWSISQGVNTVNNYVAEGINNEIYGYCSHNFWSSETKTWDDFVTAANGAGKFAYATETSHGGGGLTTTDVSIGRTINSYIEKSIFYEEGIQGELFFEVWPRGVNEINANGFYAKPIFFDNGSNGIRLRSYYIMKKFATETVDRTYISSSITNLPSIHTMGFGDNEEVALWIINDSSADYNNIPIDVTNFGIKEGMIVQQASWDDTSEITGVNQNIITTTANQFNATVKAQSINCFIIQKKYNVTPFYRIDSGSLVGNVTSIQLDEGANLTLSPQSDVAGSWGWEGPNGYTANTQEIILPNMTPAMTGDYVATYTNTDENTSIITMSVQMNCVTEPTVSPFYKINDGSLVNNNIISLEVGGKLELAPEPIAQGSWEWTGPNEFAAYTHLIILDDISASIAGDYIATYTSPEGCSTAIVFDITVTCSSIPGITPYSRIDSESWTQNTSVTLTAGSTLKLGPQSSGSGTWNWTGPNGFYKQIIREIAITDITIADAGEYTVTRTSPDGCSNSVIFTITVDDNLSTNSLNKNDDIVRIHPNPASDMINIVFEDSFVEGAIDFSIIDIKGRRVKRGILGDNKQISVNNLSKGLYFLNLKSANYSTNIKFIKK